MLERASSTAINGNTITIDAPLTNSLDPNYGGGTIYAYTWSSRIQQDGLLNMFTYSDYTGSTPGVPESGAVPFAAVGVAFAGAAFCVAAL